MRGDDVRQALDARLEAAGLRIEIAGIRAGNEANMSYATRGSTIREAVPVETVGQVTMRIKRQLEAGFGRVAVEGELSGCKPHRSGHLYTKLKDEEFDCSLNATIWKSNCGTAPSALALT